MGREHIMGRMQEPGYDGESIESALARVIKGINYALSHEGTPLIVAHGGIYHILVVSLGIEDKSMGNCEVVLFTPPLNSNGRWTVSKVGVDTFE